MNMDEFESIVDQLKTDTAAKQAEQKVIARYGELFNPNTNDNLTAEDFKSFLLFKNNCHWKGIFSTGNFLTSDVARLLEAITILLNESHPLENRHNVFFPPDNPNHIKGLSKAIPTPILLY